MSVDPPELDLELIPVLLDDVFWDGEPLDLDDPVALVTSLTPSMLDTLLVFFLVDMVTVT